MLLAKIGDVLIHERLSRRWGYQHVSQLTGVCITRLHELENNLKRPTDEELREFAGIYDQDLNKLKRLRDKGTKDESNP